MTTPAAPNDSAKTIQLYAHLLFSSLRRTHPEDQDPDIVNAHATCTRWLTLNPLPKLIPESSPKVHDPGAAGTATSAPAPRASGAGSRWPHLPVELLAHLRRAVERKPPSPMDDNEEDQRAIRITAARDMFACSLVCRAWEPAASCALWEWIEVTSDRMFVSLAFASFCSSLRLGRGTEAAAAIRYLHFASPARWNVHRLQSVNFCEKLEGLRGLQMSLRIRLDAFANEICELLVVDFLPRANILSPNLTAVDLGSIKHYAEVFALSDVDYVGIARAFRNLPCSDPRFAVLCFRPPVDSENLLADLLVACPTIQDLDLSECEPITDRTLSVFAKHPHLHHLNVSYQHKITSLAMVSFLRARGSELRFLSCDWVVDPINAIVFAPRLEHLTISLTFGFGGVDFHCRLPNLMACPLLKLTVKGLQSRESADRFRDTLWGVELPDEPVDPFSTRLTGVYRFVAAGL
ncbi:hypothetical protein BDK51DRAFT_51177 [Blyttiomyces helicus]|uniref:F-box domain-containing protein n=1 Tax=Blyttiomyces helicus TaxID=388810 RepID=A0A4P9WIB4_9FUNG|nr:hypothetical protein BDK51DRAFT_51177 [Blyttiomyces helicus]|eukprot:RKO91178.1 hypothetical protein BDK51DRAFT_51177 [Blyttiomyces helicus]